MASDKWTATCIAVTQKFYGGIGNQVKSPDICVALEEIADWLDSIDAVMAEAAGVDIEGEVQERLRNAAEIIRDYRAREGE
jgi:hypothetical protein